MMRKSDGEERDHNKDWDNFWKEICTHPDGSLNLDQIKRELSDFRYVMREAAKVYEHVTGGRLSKLMYPAEVIISVSEEVVQRARSEAVEDHIAHGDSPIC